MEYFLISDTNCECLNTICIKCYNTLAGTDSTLISDLQSNNKCLAKQNTELKQQISKLNTKLIQIISEYFYILRMECGTPRKKDRTKFSLKEYIDYIFSDEKPLNCAIEF